MFVVRHRLSDGWRDLQLGLKVLAAEMAKSALAKNERFGQRKEELLAQVDASAPTCIVVAQQPVARGLSPPGLSPQTRAPTQHGRLQSPEQPIDQTAATAT